MGAMFFFALTKVIKNAELREFSHFGKRNYPKQNHINNCCSQNHTFEYSCWVDAVTLLLASPVA
jgi:hypothetical protein